jgi:hypothetical protein
MLARPLIGAGFAGPPGSGNGGYAAGVFAGLIAGGARVTLRRPIPLDVPLDAVPMGDGAAVRHGDTLIAEVVPHRLDLDVPAAPTIAEAAEAGAMAPGLRRNRYEHCFVCGRLRHPGDGLRVFAGHVPGRPLVAARWRPHAGFADAEGLVAERHVWAALDCPGGLACDLDRPRRVLLGRYQVDVARRPSPDEDLVVYAWPVAGGSGRRLFAGSALADARGRILARAMATWIEIAAAPA